MVVDGYKATMALHAERPDLIPLLRLMMLAHDLMEKEGVEWFNDGMDELLRRGLVKVAYLSPG